MILGISANAGSGKDTAADYLVKHYNFVKMSLADEMKRICKRVYNFSDEQLWGPSEMRNKPDERYPRVIKVSEEMVSPDESVASYRREFLSPRVALQTLGTEWGRACYENTWVDATIRDAKRVLEGRADYSKSAGIFATTSDWAPTGVVIPDCRFRNEIDAIHKAGGKMVRLRRNGIQVGNVGIKGHASEMEQATIPDSDFDYVIEVEEGLENFYAQLDKMASEFGLRRWR